MFDQFLSFLPNQKARDTATTAGGMVALLAGRKLTAIGLFAKGVYGLEQGWREAHPEFKGDLKERWDLAIENYEATHADEKNRILHQIGIPMIAGGAVGLLLFSTYRPAWFLAATTFTAGWALNIVGHYKEGNKPAFADDPLSFLAGPVWDVQQTFKKARAKGENAEKSVEKTIDAAASKVEGKKHGKKNKGDDDVIDGNGHHTHA